MNWKLMFPLFSTMNLATTPTITPASGGGDSGGGGAGTGASGGGGGATVQATPTAPAQPVAPDWNAASVPAQLREGYNKLKADYEKLQGDLKPWQSLNVKPDEVGRFQQSYQQVYGEMKGIADTLNINERELADAITAHGLLPVLDQLRYEAQQFEAAQGGDPNAIQQQELEERIQAIADAKLSPVLQRENQRLVTEANTLVGNTITSLATDAFKTAGLDYAGAPPELKSFIETGVTEALKYDDEGMKALKFEGKTASIQRAFQTFQAMWDAAYLARRAMEAKTGPIARPGASQRQQQAPGKAPSLEEMINSPDTIRTSQGRPVYST